MLEGVGDGSVRGETGVGGTMRGHGGAFAVLRSATQSRPSRCRRRGATALFARTAPTVVAVADGRVIGMLHVDVSRHCFGEFGMLVDRGWRGRGVGSALVQATVEWARDHGLHKLCLEVFAHNSAAIALYRKYGFIEAVRRIKQYRRDSGELWDSRDGPAIAANPIGPTICVCA
jgi:ribosomal protein S18 acetylase RimI-like enzyme